MSRLILVTGAGRGLGYYVTKKHLELGDRIYALSRKLSDPLKKLMEEYSTLTVKLCDLSKTNEVEEAMKELIAADEPLDILYNIAGLFFENDRVPLEETDLDHCIQLFNVNAMGCLRVMKYAVPVLKNGSVLLNVSSEAGSITDCQRSQEYGYSMSKAALNMASKVFSNQVSEKGARIFCYHPGWLKTDMGGEGARLSTSSLEPEHAADCVMDVAMHPEKIPSDVMFLDFSKHPLPW